MPRVAAPELSDRDVQLKQSLEQMAATFGSEMAIWDEECRQQSAEVTRLQESIAIVASSLQQARQRQVLL